MFRSYFKTAWRNLLKQKLYTLINIFGLAIGIACCILISLYVLDELGFDKFHRQIERIAWVSTYAKTANAPEQNLALTSRAVGEALKTNYPEVKHAVRLNKWSPIISHEGDFYHDDIAFFAEEDFFKIFSFKLIEGDPNTALQGVNNMVITQSMNKKYFSEESGFGKSLLLNDSLVFKVSGIMEDVPKNSHVNFDYLVSYDTYYKLSPPTIPEWFLLNTYCYLLLEEGVSISGFSAKVNNLIMENYGDALSAVGMDGRVVVEPLQDLYLKNDKTANIGLTGDIQYVYIFSIVAVFILILACINFMNLSTAQSLERAKEVGIRKVLGTNKSSLIFQFLSESILISLIALTMALVMVFGLLPFMNQLTLKSLSFLSLFTPWILFVIAGIVLLVGLLAGLYPAFVLSSFEPQSVLKGVFKRSKGGLWVRQSLIVFQFVVSITLLVGVKVAYDQLEYMQTKHLGFDNEQMLVINAQRLNTAQKMKYESTMEILSQVSEVEKISASGTVPGKQTAMLITTAEGMPDGESKMCNVMPVDYDFINTYNMELIEGRNFSKDIVSDMNEAFIVNEFTTKFLGFDSPEEAMGKEIQFYNRQGKIVGVLKDFNFFSLKQEVNPMIFYISPPAFSYYSCKLSGGNYPDVINQLSQKWSALFPGFTFNYFFLDEDFNKQYIAEQKMTKVLGVFTVLALCIACLGLFGFVAFTVVQKTKEIGVRKVLGAKETDVIYLLGFEFGKLVLIAFFIGAPLAYIFINKWLDDFAYHISPSPWVFLYSGLLAFLLTIITVSYISIQAAWSNPIDSLRNE